MRWKRTTRAGVCALAMLSTSWGYATPSPGSPVDNATFGASGGGCAATVECGPGCSADFTHGFCLVAVKWEGSLSIGPLQIAPSILAECSVCECWYAYTDAFGNRLLRRTSSWGCGGGFPGLETHVV